MPRRSLLVVFVIITTWLTDVDRAHAYTVLGKVQACAGDASDSVRLDNGPTSLSLDTGLVFCAGDNSARNFVSADLATGELKLFAESTPDTTAGGAVRFDDNLKFFLPDGLPSAEVTANLAITGTVFGRLNGGVLPLSLIFGGVEDTIYTRNFTSPTLLSATRSVHDGEVLGIIAFFIAATDFAGAGQTENGLIDLSHTGVVSLDLPEGVTFESESGVFLQEQNVSTVPVPAALPLFLAALTMLGLIFWRRNPHQPE